jgi:hypothetical protein
VQVIGQRLAARTPNAASSEGLTVWPVVVDPEAAWSQSSFCENRVDDEVRGSPAS